MQFKFPDEVAATQFFIKLQLIAKFMTFKNIKFIADITSIKKTGRSKIGNLIGTNLYTKQNCTPNPLPRSFVDKLPSLEFGSPPAY